MLSPKSPPVWGDCVAGKLQLHPKDFQIFSGLELLFTVINMFYLAFRVISFKSFIVKKSLGSTDINAAV